MDVCERLNVCANMCVCVCVLAYVYVCMWRVSVWICNVMLCIVQPLDPTLTHSTSTLLTAVHTNTIHLNGKARKYETILQSVNGTTSNRTDVILETRFILIIT